MYDVVFDMRSVRVFTLHAIPEVIYFPQISKLMVVITLLSRNNFRNLICQKADVDSHLVYLHAICVQFYRLESKMLLWRIQYLYLHENTRSEVFKRNFSCYDTALLGDIL